MAKSTTLFTPLIGDEKKSQTEDFKHTINIASSDNSDIDIEIDTSQSAYYRRLVENSLHSSNEEKNTQHFISHLNTSLRDAQQRLETQEQKFFESKRNNVTRENWLQSLKLEKEELKESISILKSGIKKRKMPMSFLFYSMMAGTGAYLIYNIIYYFNSLSADQLNYSNFLETEQSILQAQLSALQTELSSLQTNQSILVTQLSQLKEVYSQLYNVSTELAEPVYNTVYQWYCGNNPFSTPSGQASCSNRVTIDECWDHGVGNAYCQSLWPWSWCGISGIDPCPDLITQWCSSVANVTANLFNQNQNILAQDQNIFAQNQNLVAQNDTSYQLAHIPDLFTDSFVHWVGDSTLLSIALLAFGELAFTIMLLIISATNIFNSCLTSPRRMFDIDGEEHNQVIDTANEYGIVHANTTYPSLLENFKNELKEVEKKMDHLDFYAARRAAFLNGMKEDDAKKSPICMLFHGHQLSEPLLATKIFSFAGISLPSLTKLEKRAMRTSFELGGEEKNAQPVQLDGRLQFNSLYNFFNRLRTENVNQRRHPSFTKYFAKQGGKAHDEIPVLKNIYEFAGLVPKVKK